MKNPNPVAVVMVGLPSSGKTTFAKEQFPQYQIISTDTILETLYPAQSYYESFKLANFQEVVKVFTVGVQDLVSKNKDIVIDRTNLTKLARDRVLKLIPDRYTIHCVWVDVERATILDRNKKREENGRQIDFKELLIMFDQFETPLLNEGFKTVFTVRDGKLVS